MKLNKTKRRIGLKRLLQLADFLQSLPPERFDFATWVGNGWGGKKDLSCGTTACALGWATTMPELRKLGLRMKRNGYSGWPVLNGVTFSGEGEEEGEFNDTPFVELFGVDAATLKRLFIPTFVWSQPAPQGRLRADSAPQEWAQFARLIVIEQIQEHNLL